MCAMRTCAPIDATPKKGQVMAFMLTRAKVRDFNTWKPACDAHQPARSAAGLTEKYLLRNADDPNVAR